MSSVPHYVTTAVCWHTDGGHTWLETGMRTLEVLGIAHRISSYSYRDGDTVYLEEDVDAQVFFEAADNAFWDYDITAVDYPHLCFIRALPAYRAASIPVGD